MSKQDKSGESRSSDGYSADTEESPKRQTVDTAKMTAYFRDGNKPLTEEEFKALMSDAGIQDDDAIATWKLAFEPNLEIARKGKTESGDQASRDAPEQLSRTLARLAQAPPSSYVDAGYFTEEPGVIPGTGLGISNTTSNSQSPTVSGVASSILTRPLLAARRKSTPPSPSPSQVKQSSRLSQVHNASNSDEEQ